MNPLLTDYGTNKSKPACDSYNNKGVQRVIEDNFEEDLYRDVNDILIKIIHKDNILQFQEILFQMIGIHL